MLANSPFNSVQKAILLTVCYRDIFDYPLTRQELRDYLMLSPVEEGVLDRELRELAGHRLSLSGEYVVAKGREHLVPLRHQRHLKSRERWRWARRYAEFLRWFPFIRMVAVSGSLAVNNADEGSDIDLFCIAAPGRMWLARPWMALLSRISERWLPFRACLNTSLSEADLRVPDQNLYIAHQIALLVPIWGSSAYARFVESNRWLGQYLPQVRLTERAALHDQPIPWLKRMGEWLLGGRTGDRLNHYLHRRGMQWAAYADQGHFRRLDPDSIVRVRKTESYRLGPTHIQRVYREFDRRCREHLGDQIASSEIARMFGFQESSASNP